MKFQLLYLFLLAAPLLVHVISRDTKVATVDSEPVATSPAQPTATDAPVQPAPAAAQPAAKPAAPQRIPAAHTFTFM